MSEKLAEVYEQYDLEIQSSQKGRGATILNTTEGYYILEPFRGNITRLEQEDVLKELLVKHDYKNVDSILKNKEGHLLSYDKYRQPYVMRVHFYGKECDMHEKEDILQSIDTLAHFHICGKTITKEFENAWNQHLEEKEVERMEEIKQAMENGEELEKLASLYEISEETFDKIINQNQQEGSIGEKKRSSPKLEIKANRTMEQIFDRHTREIKKIYKYIRGVKKKNEFEKLYLTVYNCFYEKATDCIRMLWDMPCYEKGETDGCMEAHYGICHGSFNQHNVILGETENAIVHFEKFSKGNQLQDLYQFARKVMEKNHFDCEYLQWIFEEYTKYIPLSKADYQYIYILFSYPEKFWKIANGYYNTNKAFLSPKYIEKLQTVILQEEEKQELLKEYKKKFIFSID